MNQPNERIIVDSVENISRQSIHRAAAGVRAKQQNDLKTGKFVRADRSFDKEAFDEDRRMAPKYIEHSANRLLQLGQILGSNIVAKMEQASGKETSLLAEGANIKPTGERPVISDQLAAALTAKIKTQ